MEVMEFIPNTVLTQQGKARNSRELDFHHDLASAQEKLIGMTVAPRRSESISGYLLLRGWPKSSIMRYFDHGYAITSDSSHSPTVETCAGQHEHGEALQFVRARSP